jgi:hypothetical protein
MSGKPQMKLAKYKNRNQVGNQVCNKAWTQVKNQVCNQIWEEINETD